MTSIECGSIPMKNPRRVEDNDGAIIEKGTFVGYSESSKVYRIYVPGERHIGVSRDVTFHEEVAFKRSKYIRCDLDMEEHEALMMEDLDSSSPHSYFEMENLEECSDSLVHEEPIEIVKRSLDVPLAKQIFTWCSDILQDTERHVAPLGSSRERKSLEIYLKVCCIDESL